MRAATVTTILGMVLISGALLAATATSTGDASNSAKGEFDRLDRNGDERIDRNEAAADARVEQQFAEMDGDGSGMLEWREFLRREDTETSGS